MWTEHQGPSNPKADDITNVPPYFLKSLNIVSVTYLSELFLLTFGLRFTMLFSTVFSTSTDCHWTSGSQRLRLGESHPRIPRNEKRLIPIQRKCLTNNDKLVKLHHGLLLYRTDSLQRADDKDGLKCLSCWVHASTLLCYKWFISGASNKKVLPTFLTMTMVAQYFKLLWHWPFLLVYLDWFWNEPS